MQGFVQGLGQGGCGIGRVSSSIIFGSKHFSIIPETFLLPQEADKFDLAFHSLKNRSKLWIVKPQHSRQGRGIQIVDSIQLLPRNSHVVVSRYIDRPFLIDGRKFDIRLYVVVTSFDPLRVRVVVNSQYS